jgi:hypothetical protein
LYFSDSVKLPMTPTKEQIQLEAEKLAAYGSVWKAVFKKPSYRKRMIIGFLTQWGAEFGGPLIIVSPYIFGFPCSISH